MPGVRYGPDISDDAAHILDFVKNVQERIRQGKKIGNRDSTRYKAYQKLALDLFGVYAKDFKAGRFGALEEMAKYGGDGSRNKIANNWRTGQQMKKSVDAEFEDRGTPDRKSRPGSSKTPQGEWYVGRTSTKRFRELNAQVAARANQKGVKFGKGVIKKGSVTEGNFKAGVDSLGIATVKGGGSNITNRPRGGTAIKGKGTSIRPAKTRKSAASVRAPKQQGERKRKVAEATKPTKSKKTKSGGTRSVKKK
jgi:hypothetical protein